MNQRQEVLNAWQNYSRTAFRSPQFEKAKQFFQLVEQRPDICWDELVPEFRAKYADALNEIVGVLMATNDPLIIHNVVRYADPNNPKEADVVKGFIQNGDVNRHEVTFQAAAAMPYLQADLTKRAKLPDSVRVAMGQKPSGGPAAADK
jgi:hypothetical protein